MQDIIFFLAQEWELYIENDFISIKNEKFHFNLPKYRTRILKRNNQRHIMDKKDMKPEFRKIERMINGTLRIVIPKNQINNLKWKTGDYIKITKYGKKIIMELAYS